MNTQPSIDDLLAGIIIAISDEIIPNLANAKAYATASMMQSVLQEIRQLVPVYETYLVDEHNDMTRVLRETAAVLGSPTGAEATRIHERAATLGQRADLPTPLDPAVLASAHRELGTALVDTIVDLDVLQRAGQASADAALDIVRAHLGPRYVRDAQTIVAGSGMLGRG